MKSKRWKELWLCSIFTCCGGVFYFSQIKPSEAKQLKHFRIQPNYFSQIPSFPVSETTVSKCKGCHKSIFNSEFNLVNTENNLQYKTKLSSVLDVNSVSLESVSLQKASKQSIIPSTLQISTTADAENVSLDKLISNTVISQK